MRSGMATMLAMALALLLAVSSVSAAHAHAKAHAKKGALEVQHQPKVLTSAEKDAEFIRSIPDPLSESGLVLVSVSGALKPTTLTSSSVGAAYNLSIYKGCYESDWSTSFNNVGTSYGVDDSLLTGLYRSGITDITKKDAEKPGINMLDGVQSCTLQRGALPLSGRVSADWWFSFGRTGWSECPTNTYMYGMYRNTRRTLDYLTYIEHVECATIDPVWSAGYNSCYTQDVTVAFDTAGWVGCQSDYFITGFWRYTDQWLHGLNKIRCCKPNLGYIGWAVGDWTSVCTGTYTRSVTCQNSAGTVVADSYCNATKPATSQTCTIPDTWSWLAGDYSDYSATCGEGATATRTVTCVNQDGARGDDSECTDSKPATIKTASGLPSCPTVGKYVYSDWSACSATCGNGTYTRDVYCPADKCIGDLPDSVAVCETGVSCTLIYSYTYSDYSACPVTCGVGVSTRAATCRTQWNVTVDASFCANLTMSTTATPCSADEVCYYEPTVGDWGDCSATCGVGVQTRSVLCDYANCYDVYSQRSCSKTECPVFTYYWAEGDWSECSATCGTVYSTRSKLCMRKEALGLVLTAQVDDVFCADVQEPTTVQLCLGLAACPVEGPYGYGDYTACSATCGLGVMTRNVWCTTPDLGCIGTEPDSSSACLIAECPIWSWSHGNWSDCSVTTCGLGTEVRSVWCENQWGGVGTAADCDGTAPDETATCEATTCDYPWAYTTWSDCSASCGLGVETRTVTCTGDAITWCADNTEPDSSQECFDATCPIYTWVSGDYTDCSVTCGTGVATRTVVCQDQWGNVSSSALCTEDEPETSQACTGASVDCISTPVYGTWSDCSVTCGEGIKTRTVTCEGVCVGDTTSQMTCEDAVCVIDTYAWTSGDWSACSTSCGKGAQTRSVTCINENAVVQTDTSLCTGTEPDSAQSCTEISTACVDLVTWVVGSWSDCSVTCGAGFKSRTVTCPAGDDALCVGTKPDDTESCIDEVCPALYEWTRGDWSDCSTQCGTGTHTRTVECITIADSSSVAFSYCSGTQPDSEEACSQYSAEICEWQVGSWSDCNATCDSIGIYTRTISCAVGADCRGVVPVTISTCAYAGDCALKFGWQTTDWSVCSESCGAKGVQTRTVLCLDSAGDSIEEALCTAQAPLPPSVQVCRYIDASNCLPWSETLWGDCSVTCGLGVRTRAVTCADPNGQCLGGEPDSDEDCNSGPCPETADWVVSSFSDCSENCGIVGISTRTVECQWASGALADITNCPSEVPDSQKSCQLVDADNCGSYVVDSWTDCPATCGVAYQTRTFSCGVTTCIGSEPYTIQECPGLLPCPTYAWTAGEFDDDSCSVTCGFGIKTRTVECIQDTTGEAVDSTYCEGSMPISVDACVGDVTVCPAIYRFRVGSWSECDATCGAGNQTRSVQCINEDTDLEVDSSLCLDEATLATAEEPQATKCCFAADCVSWQTSTWGECGTDDIQSRTVVCVGTLDGNEFEASACIASGTAGAMPVTSQSCTDSSSSATRRR